jgi:hypothetical protein
MVRVLGLELVTLLVLGFAIGILTFLYWSTKLELSTLKGENEKLSQFMLESGSETKTLKYKKSLVTRDLEQLQKILAVREEIIGGLNHQVAELDEKLVRLHIKLRRRFVPLVVMCGAHSTTTNIQRASSA